MNCRKKGYRREKEYADMKEKIGYSTFRPAMTKFGVQDIFGCFDVLCMNKEEVLLVQVKSNVKSGMKEVRAFTNHPKCVKKIIAVKKDYGDWVEHYEN